jgi:hypothetical protein
MVAPTPLCRWSVRERAPQRGLLPSTPFRAPGLSQRAPNLPHSPTNSIRRRNASRLSADGVKFDRVSARAQLPKSETQNNLATRSHAVGARFGSDCSRGGVRRVAPTTAASAPAETRVDHRPCESKQTPKVAKISGDS